MRGERVGQPEGSRQPGAVEARAQDPDRHLQPGAGHRHDRLSRLGRAEIFHQLDDVVREGVDVHVQVSPQRHRRARVRARRAADPEVDAAGKERLQGAELLGDHQRGVVGQHDPARPDADGRGAAGAVPDDDGGGGAGHAGQSPASRGARRASSGDTPAAPRGGRGRASCEGPSRHLHPRRWGPGRGRNEEP